MNSIDQRIQAALSDEDKILIDQYREDQNIFSDIAISFRGVRGFIVSILWIMVLVLTVLFGFCAIKFFNADLIESKITWLGCGLVAAISIIACKLFYFMDMNRTALMRELKRLELQVSLLSDDTRR